MATIKITSASHLLAVLKNASKTCKGQWASITYNAPISLNQFPNEEFCLCNGITLAVGKGSKALNEPYRITDGFSACRKVKAMFHLGQSYIKTLTAKGGTPSETKDTDTLHLGGGVTLKADTAKYGFIFAYYAKADKGFFVDGRKATPTETEYIKGYMSASKGHYNSLVDFRTPNLCNIKEIAVGKNIYVVDIKDISDIKVG